MAEAPQTFEEARSEWSKEREEEGEEPILAELSEAIPDEEDLEDRLERLETIMAASPRKLSKRGVVDTVDTGERASDLAGSIRVRLGGVEDLFGDLGGQLEDAESQIDILTNIAQSNITISDRLEVLAETQVDMLEAIFDILATLEPFSRITVSGTNEIGSANNPEVVVPESDSTAIPTRALFIKASDENTEEIAFGDDETQPDSGFILDKGESMTINIDLRNETLYMASASSGQVVELMGFS